MASGTQVAGTVQAPVDVTGNAVSVLGDATSTAVAPAATAPAPAPATSAPSSPSAPTEAAPTTTGSDGIASGTQVVPVVSIPVTVSGNGIGLLGDGTSTGSSTGTGSAGASSGTSGATTTGSDGIASGTQVVPVVSIPVTVSGNGIGLLGDGTSTGSSTGTGTTGTPGAGTSGPATTGSDGVAIRDAGRPGGLDPGDDRRERHRHRR